MPSGSSGGDASKKKLRKRYGGASGLGAKASVPSSIAKELPQGLSTPRLPDGASFSSPAAFYIRKSFIPDANLPSPPKVGNPNGTILDQATWLGLRTKGSDATPTDVVLHATQLFKNFSDILRATGPEAKAQKQAAQKQAAQKSTSSKVALIQNASSQARSSQPTFSSQATEGGPASKLLGPAMQPPVSQATQKDAVSRLGPRSLFATCLRQVPTYLALAVESQALKEPEQQIDVVGQVYDDLETLGPVEGQGWVGLKRVVRSHAVLAVADAVRDRTIPMRSIKRLIETCIAETKSTQEAEQVLGAFCDSLKPGSGTSALDGKSLASVNPFGHCPKNGAQHRFANDLVKSFGKLCGGNSPVFRVMTRLLKERKMPLDWCFASDFMRKVSEAVSSVGGPDSAAASDFIQTVLRLCCGLHEEGEPHQEPSQLFMTTTTCPPSINLTVSGIATCLTTRALEDKLRHVSWGLDENESSTYESIIRPLETVGSDIIAAINSPSSATTFSAPGYLLHATMVLSSILTMRLFKCEFRPPLCSSLSIEVVVVGLSLLNRLHKNIPTDEERPTFQIPRQVCGIIRDIDMFLDGGRFNFEKLKHAVNVMAIVATGEPAVRPQSDENVDYFTEGPHSNETVRDFMAHLARASAEAFAKTEYARRDGIRTKSPTKTTVPAQLFAQEVCKRLPIQESTSPFMSREEEANIAVAEDENEGSEDELCRREVFKKDTMGGWAVTTPGRGAKPTYPALKKAPAVRSHTDFPSGPLSPVHSDSIYSHDENIAPTPCSEPSPVSPPSSGEISEQYPTPPTAATSPASDTPLVSQPFSRHEHRASLRARSQKLRAMSHGDNVTSRTQSVELISASLSRAGCPSSSDYERSSSEELSKQKQGKRRHPSLTDDDEYAPARKRSKQDVRTESKSHKRNRDDSEGGDSDMDISRKRSRYERFNSTRTLATPHQRSTYARAASAPPTSSPVSVEAHAVKTAFHSGYNSDGDDERDELSLDSINSPLVSSFFRKKKVNRAPARAFSRVSKTYRNSRAGSIARKAHAGIGKGRMAPRKSSAPTLSNMSSNVGESGSFIKMAREADDETSVDELAL
ncbi:hypothetical protein BDY21DRAFT_348820 [Lineolata rhizophorae]|uniref:Uncharacterized protein n=1 Tax=Lineolata rhizophorae TaxID=578093 RepID=A0A6A6NWI8_9PEZI|nr:hypothetical protein BDY21DRAFT_348820 [Lineolata rhizophorae]